MSLVACLQIDSTTIEVTELPIRKWTQDYKEFLEGLIKPEDKTQQPMITDYRDNSTDTSVHFTITMTESKLNEALAAGLYDRFKLCNKISIGEEGLEWCGTGQIVAWVYCGKALVLLSLPWGWH